MPFLLLALGIRSQPMIIPHDPIEYTSNLFPMLHAHFVITTLEGAAEEARALVEKNARRGEGAAAGANGAPPRADADEEAPADAARPASPAKAFSLRALSYASLFGGSVRRLAPPAGGGGKKPAREKAVDDEEASPDAAAAVAPGAVAGAGPYAFLVVGCAAAWAVAFCAVDAELRAAAAGLFTLASLALPRAATRAGRPPFATCAPACVFVPVYVLLGALPGVPPAFASSALVSHGALVLFAGPARRAEDGGPVLRVVHVAEQNAIPRWAAALYFVLTAACVAGTTLAVIFGSDLMSTCQPCKCKGNVLLNCDVFARAESLTLIDALNVNSFVAEIDLSAKSIRRIDPYAFDGLSGVEVLKLSNNALSEMRPGTFSGLDRVQKIELDGNELTQLAGHTFRGNPELSYVNIEENPVEVIEAPATYLYAGHSLQCIEVFNATHREGVHLVLVVEGGRATCRHTDANSCPSGMDIWVPRSYAHAQTVVRKVGADLAALAGVYRDGAQREWNGIDWSTGEQEYAMTSAGQHAYNRGQRDWRGGRAEPWQSVAGDPWFLRALTPDAPYAANREGLSAADESYNEPGCWLQSGGWEDGAGFALLPGNWCADCFTQYLCSSNLGKYVLAPDAPTPRPVPGAGAGADVCDGDAAAAAGAVSTYGAASPPDALGLDDVYVAGEYGECEGSDGATGARVRVNSKYSDKCDVHGAKKECLTLNDGAEACEMTQEECEAGCAAENAVIMGNCVAYSLTDKGLCRIFGANVHVGVGIGGACWTPAPADRATRVSHVKRPAGFTDSVACWRLRCELTGKCAEPDWFARGEAAGTRSAAAAYCRGVGGELASILDAAENERASAACGDGAECWIGLAEDGGTVTTPAGSQTWRWPDESAATYTNWAPARPDNDGLARDERVAAMSGGAWNDHAVGADHAYPLCRMPYELRATAKSGTLHCLEVDGSRHDVLRVDDGVATCGRADPNSCPPGFDVWVPRSYAHAKAVVDLRGAAAVNAEGMVLGIYRAEDGCGPCGGLAMTSRAQAGYGYGAGWGSVAGDPWFVRGANSTDGTFADLYAAGDWLRVSAWAEGDGFDFEVVNGAAHPRRCATSYYCSTNALG